MHWHRCNTSKKLDHIKVGPFFIKNVKGPVNYELDLPPDAKRKHSTFHISLLEKAKDSEPVATEFGYTPDEEDTYNVERILEERNGHFLIKWKNYPDSDNTWEPEYNLLPNCAKMLKDFRQQQKERTLRRMGPQRSLRGRRQ